MAGPATWKGQVQFNGLFGFPIIAKSAVREEKIAFNQHCAEHGARVRAGGMVCETGGETLSRDQIVRGYMGVSPIDEDWISSLSMEKSPLLTVEAVVSASQIDARYYQKSYDVLPDKGGEKGAFLVLKLLEESDSVAIGRLVASQKEVLVVLRPRAGALAMELLYWPTEILSNADAKGFYDTQSVTPGELAMGRKLFELMESSFKPEAYPHTHYTELVAGLNDMIEGRTPAPVPSARPSAFSGASLEDQLAAALAAAGAPAEKAKPAKKKKVA